MNHSISQDRQGATRPRQQTRPFTIALTIQDPIDLISVDDWLKSTLAIDTESFAAATRGMEVGPDAQVAGLVYRYLLLIRMFLQYSSIPAFDPGNIIKIDQDEKDASKWIACIAVANIDLIPPRCYLLAIESADMVAKWCMKRPKTADNIKKLHNIIENQVILPLRKMVIAGKSTVHVLRAAYQRDIPFFHRGAGVYQLGWGSKARLMDRSISGADTAIGAKMAQNKVWSANLIRIAGLPAPVHGVVATKEDAIRVAHQLGWPVVVKPADCDRGEGVAIGLTDDQLLLSAFETAQGVSGSQEVIVEREVSGACHRLFIAEGRLLYAVKRLPKSVEGDGKRTVAELIIKANQAEESVPPWLRSDPFPNDALTAEALAAAGHRLDSVPGEGEWVALRRIETTRWGGRFVDVSQFVHPDNLEIAIRAAELFGLNVAGVDLMTSDIQTPWHENGAIINEVNFSPLLGGIEISRSYLPEFFNRFIDGDGRIPIETFVGGDAVMALAQRRQEELIDAGRKCFLSSHELTLTGSGHIMAFPFQSLFKRCQALLMNLQVETLILVIQTDEVLHAGLPVDRLSKITSSGELRSWKNPTETLPRVVIDRLLGLLKARCLSGSEHIPES